MIRSRYEVQAALGVGRLGAVLNAIDVDSGEPVAVKVIHPALIPDESVGRQFLVGMRAMVRMTHENLNRVRDVNCEGDRYFVVYELLDGVPLRDLMSSRRDQGRGFAIAEVFPIMRQVTTFLMESELRVHGSISPENLWILPERLMVLDANLALQLPGVAVGHLLSEGRRPGGYTAPEVARGGVPDERSDVYSLCVILGEMLTQIAFDGRPEIFAQSDPDLPEEVDTILRRGLLGDPRGRYADSAELLEAIAATIAVPAPVFERPTPVDDLASPPLEQGAVSAEVALGLVPASAPIAAPRPAAAPRAGPPQARTPRATPIKAAPPGAKAAPPAARAAPPAAKTAPPAAKAAGPVPVATPPVGKTAKDFGLDHLPDSTVQVSMEDVIRAHAEATGGRPASPVPPVGSNQPPAARLPSTPPPAARRPSTPPPARHSSTPPPPRRVAAPPPTRRPSTPPPARHPSSPPPRMSSTPAPPVQEGAAAERQPPMVKAPPLRPSPARIAPRRPAPLKRDTIPPPGLSPPMGGVQAQRPTRPPPRREVTQEIDLDAIEAVEEIQPRREVTQEVDLDQIVSVDRSSMVDAVSKLEAQASEAEAASANELLKRADKLEGVDPRFVRAAHRLESERKGSRSRRAAELLRERASELDGIDPRLLRAAARLEEAKVSEVAQPEEPASESSTEEPGEASDDDWRVQLAQSAEDSVISFIAPPVVQRSREVSGFPRTQQRTPRSRPPTEPPRAAPPPARRGRKREPHNPPRALYDDSGETDDESQPTILVDSALLPRTANAGRGDRRLKIADFGLRIAIGLLLVVMVGLLMVAAISA